MSEEALASLTAHVSVGSSALPGPSRRTDGGANVSRPQRPCTTPESADKHFLPVMSPDTTSTGGRGAGLMADVLAADAAGMFRSCDVLAKGKAMA